MNIVTDSSGLVFAISTGFPAPPPGGSLYPLSDDQWLALGALREQPNAGIRFDGSSFELIPPPPPPPPPVPRTAPAGYFLVALIRLGHFNDIDTFVKNAPSPLGDELRALWSRASEFLRNDQRLTFVAKQIGMTDAQIDEVFVLANSPEIKQ